MVKIGLTGGVGAGKSRVLSWMEKEWGANIIRTDEVAQQLLEPEEEGYCRVVEALGTSFLDESKRINRPALAKLIFQDEGARKIVDEITHPLVWEKVKEEIGLAMKEGGCRMVVVESALFDESALSFLDEIWYVYASEEIRAKRLMESRGYSLEKCRAIFASQKSHEEFSQFCKKRIENGEDWEKTKERLKEMFVDFSIESF